MVYFYVIIVVEKQNIDNDNLSSEDISLKGMQETECLKKRSKAEHHFENTVKDENEYNVG